MTRAIDKQKYTAEEQISNEHKKNCDLFLANVEEGKIVKLGTQLTVRALRKIFDLAYHTRRRRRRRRRVTKIKQDKSSVKLLSFSSAIFVVIRL